MNKSQCHPTPAAEKERTDYFALLPASVLEDEALPDGALRVYAQVARYAAGSGFCWAGNARMMKECRKSERSLQELLRLLEKRGHIVRETDENGRRRICTVTTPQKSAPPPAEICASPAEICASPAEIDAPPRGNLHHAPANICTQNNKKRILKNNNHKNSPSSPPKEEQEVWFDFCFEAYPNHNGRTPALRRWLGLKPTYETAGLIYRSIQSQKAAGQYSPDYWPQFANWLRDERWKDALKTGRADADTEWEPGGGLIETEEVVYW